MAIQPAGAITVSSRAGLTAPPATAGREGGNVAPATSLALGPAAKRQLTLLYAAYRHLPLRDIAGIYSARGAQVISTGRRWALVIFNASSASVAIGFQDGAGTGLFTRPPGEPWTIVSLGGLSLCDAGLPATVRGVLGLPGCSRLSSHIVSKRPSHLVLGPAGTVDDLVDAATNELGDKTNPVVYNFGGLDCNAYATLVNAGQSTSGCGTDSRHSDVQDENQLWCADFMKWLWQGQSVADTSQLTAWSGSFSNWGIKHNETVTLNGTNPQVGDAMVFLHGVTQNQVNTQSIPSNNSDHVAIVTAVNSDGTIDTINGDVTLGSNPVEVAEVDNYTPAKMASTISGNSSEQWVFVSPQLGSGSTRPSTPTTPVVDFPGWSSEYVFAQGTDNSVQVIQRTSAGWGNWKSLGNNINGTPAGFAEQSGQLDVFANTAGGVLQGEREASGGWEPWVALASGTGLPTNFTASPFPVYDQALSRNEVYDTTSTGAVYLLYGGSGPMSSWTSWTHLSGLTAQGPVAPVYDPVNNQMDVFATSSSGTLYYDARPAGGSWSGWFPVGASLGLPTDFNRSPVAVYDPVLRRIEVYDTESSGTIVLAFGTGANPGSWTGNPYTFSSLSIMGKPAVLADNQVSGNNQIDLFATSSAGYLNENINTGSGWSGWNRVDSGTPQKLNGTPYAIYDQVLARNETFFTEAGNQLGYYYGTDPNASSWTGLKVFNTLMVTM